jgi:hypothetical protein
MSSAAISAARGRILTRVSSIAGTHARTPAAAGSAAPAFDQILPGDRQITQELSALWRHLDALSSKNAAALTGVPASFVDKPEIRFDALASFASKLEDRVRSSVPLFAQHKGDTLSAFESKNKALVDAAASGKGDAAKLASALGKDGTALSPAQDRLLAAVSHFQAKIEAARKEAPANEELPKVVEDALVDALVPVERAIAVAAAEAEALAATSAVRLAELEAELKAVSEDLAKLEVLSVEGEAKRHPEWNETANAAIASHSWNLIPNEVDKEAH